LQIAEQRGAFGFGQAADQGAFAPKGQLTAIVDNWGPYYIERTKAVLDGTWESHSVWYGLKEGMVEIAPYGPAVPEDVKAEAERVKAEIVAGTLHPFAGPIKNQAGEVKIAEGASATDEELSKMDWYVQGVQA
jgi:simple sugar transport system substrate-binding protein